MISKQERLRLAFDRLARLMSLNAPAAIIGYAAVTVAALGSSDGTRRGLIRHLIQFERDLVICRDPDSKEYAELEAMEKDLDDLEVEDFCLELQETKTKEIDDAL